MKTETASRASSTPLLLSMMKWTFFNAERTRERRSVETLLIIVGLEKKYFFHQTNRRRRFTFVFFSSTWNIKKRLNNGLRSFFFERETKSDVHFSILSTKFDESLREFVANFSQKQKIQILFLFTEKKKVFLLVNSKSRHRGAAETDRTRTRTTTFDSESTWVKHQISETTFCFTENENFLEKNFERKTKFAFEYQIIRNTVFPWEKWIIRQRNVKLRTVKFSFP